jgi:hypothetical protein
MILLSKHDFSDMPNKFKWAVVMFFMNVMLQNNKIFVKILLI